MEATAECPFTGRVAVITGAGAGLGRAYALALARYGANVIVNDIGVTTSGQGRSEQPADAVVAEIAAQGGRAIASHDSVATRAGGRAIVELALARFGRIDILVSNAGFLRRAAFDKLSADDIDAVIDVHLKGAFHVGQPAFAAMKAQGYGRILLTSSPAGAFGSVHQANYVAAKAGILGLSQAIAIEGRSHGVLCNAILPNSRTRMADAIDLSWMDDVPDMAEYMRRQAEAGFLPDPRRMEPDWVVPLALYLVSEGCRVTRQAFSAHSGRFARVFLGVTEGWVADALPHLADIDAALPQISQASTFHEPQNVFEEAALVRDAVRMREPAPASKDPS